MTKRTIGMAVALGLLFTPAAMVIATIAHP